MNRLCKNCGSEISENERICPKCGTACPPAEIVGAEWQGKWHYEYGGTATPAPRTEKTETSTLPPSYVRKRVENTREKASEEKREPSARAQKSGGISRRRALFFLSFIGLLLDFFWGLGFLICLPAAIVASIDLAKLYRTENKCSTQLVWACVIGYLGAILGLAFFVMMV